MHTKFSGSDGQNAHRWLRTLRYENPQITTVSPSDWLGIIDGLLEGDAATWADHHPRVKHILRVGSLKEATRADVETFKKALIARFPPVEVTIGQSRPGLIISSPVLEQAPNEDLDSYYQRTLIWLYQRNGVDLAEAPLTEQEHDALKKTVRSHIAGLTDDQIRREAEKVWIDSAASLSLLQIHKLSKDKKLLKWLGEEQNRMETRLPGQAARDETPNRANVPSSSSDSTASTSNMGNVGLFSNPRTTPDNLPKPNNEKFATGAGDMRSNFIDLMKGHSNVYNEMRTGLFGTSGSAEKDPTSKYRPFPELLPRKPTNATASTWDQVRYPPHETGFTSRMGNSHHTPNTSDGSNPPTKLPTASMFGGATGSPSRPRSSVFEESYSIFDARHPANKDRTVPPGYREAARFFNNCTNRGANHATPPQDYSGMPPPRLSLFEPLTRKPDGSMFGNDTVTGANRGNSPQHYTGMPPPGLSLFDPLPKKPTSSLFGGDPAPGRAAKGASPNRHSRRSSNLEVEPHLPPSRLSEDTVRQFYSPSRNIFGNFSTQSPSGIPNAANPSNTTSHHQAPSIQIQTPSIFDTPAINSTVPEDRPTGADSNSPFPVSMDRFMDEFTPLDTHPSSQDTDPAHDRHGPNNSFQTSMDQFIHSFIRPDTHPSSQDTSPTHNRQGPNNPFQTSMDDFIRDFGQLDTKDQNQDTDPALDRHGTNTPSNPTNATSPLSYSQTLTAAPHQQATVESDPETETEPGLEIPITIKQSQGRRKRGRRG